MHIHILGICGTFMGSLAILARAQGLQVTGSDKNVYPPMSIQLEAWGIEILPEGALPGLAAKPDLIVIGNALSRGQVDVEYVLNEALPYCSGPEWLREHVLAKKWVFAVAGTHGKTTTSSLLAWILDCAGLEPGFLIGGVPLNFGVSSRLTKSQYFVVEADEYDTAFFDKRSKFVHYRPRTAILNNLEYDHADIFPDLRSIEKQFHQLLRSVPAKGQIIVHAEDLNLARVLSEGVWSQTIYFGLGTGQWRARVLAANGQRFVLQAPDAEEVMIDWSMVGLHNVQNALAACAAAATVNVSLEVIQTALGSFRSVERRLQLRGEVQNIRVYDDFAHHPTAIETTVLGLRATIGQERILAILDLRSNSMKMGVHQHRLAASLKAADLVFIYAPTELAWDISLVTQAHQEAFACVSIAQLVEVIVQQAKPGDHLLVMSNGSFEGIHDTLLERLSTVQV